MTINGESTIHLINDADEPSFARQHHSMDTINAILMEVKSFSINQHHMSDKIDKIDDKIDEIRNKVSDLEMLEKIRQRRSAFIWNVIQASPWVCFFIASTVTLLCALGGVKISQGITYEANQLIKQVRGNL